MTSPALNDLIAYTKAHAGARADAMVGFVIAYYENADPEEIALRGPADLFALANAHWRLLETTTPASLPRVRVFNPSLEEDGFSSDHSVLQIVHEDMPFLVDSVTMAVNASRRTAHWIVHPLLAVCRSADGRVSAARRVDPGVANAANESVISLITVECDRIVAADERVALASELERVLGDVRATVQDWRPMLDRLRLVCESSQNAPLSEATRSEGIA
ncbi:MAG: NAD-glutamate dehydrogenase, partial [Burkholderiaceae bacterium]